MAIHGLPDTDDINGEAAINTPGLIDGHRRMANHGWSSTDGQQPMAAHRLLVKHPVIHMAARWIACVSYT